MVNECLLAEPATSASQIVPLSNRHFHSMSDTNFGFSQKIAHPATKHIVHKTNQTNNEVEILDAHETISIHKLYTLTEGEPYGQFRGFPSLRAPHISYIAQYSSECLSLTADKLCYSLYMRKKSKSNQQSHEKIIIFRALARLPLIKQHIFTKK